MKDTTKVVGGDMGGSVPVKTPMSKGGSRPSGFSTEVVRARNLVIPATSAGMDCSPKLDTLGDTTRKGSAPGLLKSDIDVNKRG